MIGLSGLYNFENIIGVDENMLSSMTNSILHRGSYRKDYVVSNNFGLSVNSLRLIRGEINENIFSNQCVIVAIDGDIFNHDKIWEKLISKDNQIIKSENTAELIAYGYMTFGLPIFNMLDGDFAISIFDRNMNTLVLAKDRFGSKPLFYHQNESGVIFCSEIKGILACNIRKAVNFAAVHEYLSARYVIGEETLFTGIHKVKNNFAYTFCDGVVKKDKIYNFPDELSEIRERDVVDQIDESIVESVQQRINGFEKVGLFLSGGIDSMSLVPILKHKTNTKIFSFTASFSNNLDYDETAIAKDFAFKNKIDHKLCLITAKDYIENLDKLICAKDGPSCINSEVAIYIILDLIKKKGIKVAIGGDNADSIFASAHNDVDIENDFIRIKRLKRIIPRILSYPVFVILIKLFSKGYRLKRILDSDLADYYYSGYFPIEDKHNLYKRGFKLFLKKDNRTRLKLREYFKDYKTQDFKRLLFNFHHDHYAVTNIMRVENPSASHSLIYRLPYVANKLLGIARSIPYYYVNHPTIGNKYLLLKWAERYLPKKSIYREKKYAFNVPFNYWLQNDPAFCNSIKKTLLDKNSFISTIMETEKLTAFIERCIRYGDQNEAIRLWRIYNLEKWHTLYFKDIAQNNIVNFKS
jgi:asparagine synthase (glutamine-hydrolysing)